ncbi:MAG: alpha/beta fold hydrolase [Holophagaceae bacterium]|nr:alpha/beta fold hydrolase [Holophagaceae bacterium]
MAMLLRDGGEIYYELHGEGAPLLLLPGLGSDVLSWGSLVTPLAQSHHVILMDNRGAGRTRGSGPLTIGAMAADALALLEHLGHPRVHVLGHSMGGLVALTLASLAPARLDRLVLAGSFAALQPRNLQLFRGMASALEQGADRADWYQELFAWIFSEGFLGSAQAVRAAAQLAADYPLAPTPAEFRGQVEALAAWDASTGLGAVTHPTLVLAAQDDRLVLTREGRALAAALPRGTYQELPGAAHAMHLEQPEAFLAAARAFLA